MSTVDPARKKGVTRRTGGIRAGGRAARVVEVVLRTTAEELGRRGYAGLRVEDVAERANVNKTTIYRRWPTKAELVAATVREVAAIPPDPDTGSVREDLLVLLRQNAQSMRSPLKRGIVRMLHMERSDPEVDRIVRTLRNEVRQSRAMLVERGIARGELPVGAPSELMVDLVFAPVLSRLVTHGDPVDDEFFVGIVDLVLAGAKHLDASR
jgi:AcrR family transcriptional regulator